ncbi:MAG: threonine--tRNA ligase [Verrucomicrobia bacterium]|jgi:threonyl-tRNA synthetase|nr:threonine--tRNA ligase [Verrucomicrobiota bacterium]MDA1204637.1 threonine--tRNA ligase [Verrucomicrobiota bacterium]
MTELETLRHSCAHVLAEAILRLWPEAQFAAGPPVEQGFYYDVDLPHRISPEDFAKIEAEMQKIITADQPFERKVVSRAAAMELGRAGQLAALGERGVPSRYKLDILENIAEGEEISLYRNGAFTDLCAGPHVASTGQIGAFALTAVASAYYKGDESNPQLQRIYGIAFAAPEELAKWREMMEEARKRDHRKLGKELQLFHVDEAVGAGLILWTPKGAVVRQELQNFIGEELRRQGYEQVFTPHIGRLELFRTSGHYPYYADSQYPPLVERETLHRLAEEGCTCADLAHRLEQGEIEGYLLKPMNCPMHIKIFASQPRSYRDLPVRLAEFGTVYRWEQSGELNGMTRVRGFTQDDAHLFVTEDQMGAEIQGCLDLVKKVFRAFDMQDYRVRLGLREPGSHKYVGQAEDWDRAEEACRQAARTLGVPYSEERGEAAFYGPKIDFVVRDVIGREWQLGTVQVDFQLPERFDLHYTGADNKPHRPVMIHRAPFGSMERFVGVLIEHFAGAFPVWLAPEQARVLPVSEKVADYAQEVAAALRGAGVRVAVDTSQDKLGAKIRLAQVEKVPYMIVVGAKEAESRQISVRSRKAGDEGLHAIDSFVERIKKEISERVL